VNAAVVNTSSTSGLFNNPGQANYGAAKTGIATLTMIAQAELERYGVRVNAIAPSASTRLLATVVPEPSMPEADGWSPLDPANISPFVGYLCTATCPIKGRIFVVRGSEVRLIHPFSIIDGIEGSGRWAIADLREQAARFADVPFELIAQRATAAPTA
jgi:NAD(P)-dependent dehydrogenase (short-subunit alcohol dehydrogenase family)